MHKRSFGFVLIFLQFTGMMFVNMKLLPVSCGTPDLAKITAGIIKTCSRKWVKEIGLVGNLPDSFFASLASGDPLFETVSFNNERSLVQSEVVSKTLQHKLPIFVIATASPVELGKSLVDVKNSRWWNHLAEFYILDSSEKEGCSQAFGFLWTAWEMDILKAQFICNRGNDSPPLIYMFNPYTKDAPRPWKSEQTRQGINNHPWTLFTRPYHGDVDVCENLHFDQTSDVGGYEVHMTTFKNLLSSTFEKPGKLSTLKESDWVYQTMTQYMNFTVKLVLHSGNESLGSVDKNGRVHGLLADLTNGRSDFVFRFMPITFMSQLPATYPPMYVEDVAVTQYTDYLTQWQKVISAIDYFSRIGLCVVLVVNVVFLKYALGQSFMNAFLDTLRMICNSCFVKLPSSLGPRIYLAGLFCFVVIIQACYQGQLAARLTKHERYPNVNNRHDLIKSDYILHGFENFDVAFSDSALKKRYIPLRSLFGCADLALHNVSIACVGPKEILIKGALKSKLHMSKNAVAESAVKFAVRENWPLEKKLNRYVYSIAESGLLRYQYIHFYTKAMRTLDVNENGNGNDGYRVLTLADLDFAFGILVIGLGCAAVSFLLEILVARCLSRR